MIDVYLVRVEDHWTIIPRQALWPWELFNSMTDIDENDFEERKQALLRVFEASRLKHWRSDVQSAIRLLRAEMQREALEAEKQEKKNGTKKTEKPNGPTGPDR